jgi:LAGLIDADG endonuclease
MRVSQKQLYKVTSDIPLESNSNFQIMENIREFLDIKTVNKIKRTRENFVELSYEVRTTKKTSCNLLINYLSVYPLFSSKHQDFLD